MGGSGKRAWVAALWLGLSSVASGQEPPAPFAETVDVNVVNVEAYLRGVIPNELSPAAFPQISFRNLFVGFIPGSVPSIGRIDLARVPWVE